MVLKKYLITIEQNGRLREVSSMSDSKTSALNSLKYAIDASNGGKIEIKSIRGD